MKLHTGKKVAAISAGAAAMIALAACEPRTIEGDATDTVTTENALTTDTLWDDPRTQQNEIGPDGQPVRVIIEENAMTDQADRVIVQQPGGNTVAVPLDDGQPQQPPR